MRKILRFWFGGFIERSNLSPFGFILHCWTMMFLCMILLCSSLRFQRAQDHRKRSPDEKDIAVFVSLFLSTGISGGRNIRGRGPDISALKWVFTSFRAPGACLWLNRTFGLDIWFSRPDIPAPTWTGISGPLFLQRLFFWEGYKYPSTYLQPASFAQHVFLSLPHHC